MKQKSSLGVLFLISFIFLHAQDKPDTITKYDLSIPSAPKVISKVIRDYNARGQLVSEKTFLGMGSILIQSQSDLYSYNKMGSLESFRQSNFTPAYGLRPNRLELYKYEGTRLVCVKTISKYEGDTGRPYQNWEEVEALIEKIVPGKLFTTNDRTEYVTFEYDAENRLTKRTYTGWLSAWPEHITVYFYDGKSIPELETEKKYWSAYHLHKFLYKDGRLQEEIHRDYSNKGYSLAHVTTVKTVYHYSDDGKLESIMTYEDYQEEYKRGKWDAPHDELTEKRTFQYNNGKLVSEKIENKDEYKVERYSFWDKLGALHYQTYNRGEMKFTEYYSDPVKKTTKTKHKWYTHVIQHADDSNAIKKSNPGNVYDNKGRLIEEQYSQLYHPVGNDIHSKEYDPLKDLWRPVLVRYGYKN